VNTVWLDGRFLPESAAKIPATDPAVLHGRGLFETLRAYDGIPFRLADHVARMAASARHFRLPFRPPDFEPVIRTLCRRNRCPDAAVRLTLTAGGRLLVTSRPRKALPAAWYRKGAEVMVAEWRRDPRAPLAGHKTTSYLEHVLAHEEALKRGCADALFVGLRGELLEGCVTNVFLVREGRLVTPRLSPGILPGVTRKVVLGLASAVERIVRLKELWTADEVFLTNALIEILPVVRPPGPITQVLMDAYGRLTRA
jgi:branched-subunit amino acid aminotransferase/4-amino-4-deoxychorismate lyase